MVDRDQERWRLICARLLLCITMMVCLGASAFLSIMMPKMHSTRAFLFAGSLFVLCAFGAFGLSRMRFAAIVAIGIAALLSTLLLARFVIYGHLAAIVVPGGIWNWRKLITFSLAFMLYEIPAAVFFMVWPLRRTNAATSTS